jgi:carbonic anhydrase/acetyltransferase-like protein (isoleucine patch superfamily)
VDPTHTVGGGRDQTAVIGHAPEHRDWKPGDLSYPPTVMPDARIEAFVSVDAGMKRSTFVGNGVWLQKHVHVGHDALIFDGCELAPGVVVCGHAELGHGVRVGVNASILPWVKVGRQARIGSGAVVTHNVPAGQSWAGNPARPVVDLGEGRFWSKVDIQACDECWPWTAGRYLDGYGQFWWEGVNHHASRIAFILAYKRQAGSLLVCHTCDNPPCCNPAHLFLGTHRDNAADMVNKGRVSRRFGLENANMKLSDEEVEEVRVRYANGDVTQRELAEEFGCDQSLVSLITSGKYRLR